MNLPDDCGPEDFLAWTHHPVTRAFMQSLESDKQLLSELWASKKFIGENADQTNFLNAEALAKVSTLDEILTNIEESTEDARKEIQRRQQEN